MSRVQNLRIEISNDIQSIDQTKVSGFDVTDRLVSFFYSESLLTGLSILRIELMAEFPNSDESLMFTNTFRAFRISITKDGVEQTSGWILFVCENSSLYYKGTNSVIKIVGSSRASDLTLVEKYRAFLNRPASSVFSEIATKNGLVLVSPSVSAIGSWYQLAETDWDFMRRVASDVTTDTGNRKLYVFVKNNNLKIMSLEFNKPVVRRFGLGVGDDRTDDIKFIYGGRDIDRNCGSSMTSIGFDIRRKRTISAFPHITTKLPFLAGKLPRKIGSGTNFIPSSEQDEYGLNRVASTIWEENAQRYFSFQGRVPGDLNLQLGDIIEMSVEKEEHSSSLNGKYPIYEIVHDYDIDRTKELVTYIGGFRRSFHYGKIPADGQLFTKIISTDTYSVTGKAVEKTVLKAIRI